jgi:hypothetical protein
MCKCKLYKLLKKLLDCPKRSKIKPHINFDIQVAHTFFYGVLKMKIKAGQIITAHISPTDAYGNPAKIDGLPIWEVSDPTIASIDLLDETGLTAIITSIGLVGEVIVSVSVTVDADLGETIKTLSGQLQVEVESGMAVDLGFHIEPEIEIEVN